MIVPRAPNFLAMTLSRAPKGMPTGQRPQAHRRQPTSALAPCTNLGMNMHPMPLLRLQAEAGSHPAPSPDSQNELPWPWGPIQHPGWEDSQPQPLFLPHFGSLDLQPHSPSLPSSPSPPQTCLQSTALHAAQLHMASRCPSQKACCIYHYIIVHTG